MRQHGTRLAAGLGWVASDGAGGTVIAFVTLLVTARVLGPVEFGRAALVIAVVQFLNVFAEGLFHDAIVQRQHVEPEHMDSAFWAALGLGAALALGCAAASPLLARGLADPPLAPLLSVAAISLPFAAITGVAGARLRRRLEFRAVAWRSLLGRLAAAASSIALALAGWGAWSLVLSQLAASMLLAALLTFGGRWRPRRCIVRARLAELGRFAGPQLLRQALWMARLQGFLTLTGSVAGIAAVGQLNLGFRVVNTLQNVVTTALQQFTLPLLARRQHDRQALCQAYHRTGALVAVLAFPAFGGLAVTAKDLVPLALGAEWRGAVPVVEILATAAVLHFAGFAAAMVITATGRLRYALFNAAASLLVTLGGVLWLRPGDAAAAALFWAAPFLLVLLFAVFWLWRLLRLRPGALARPFFAPALATAWMALAVEAVGFAAAGQAAMLRLADEIAVGAVVYVGALMVLDRGWRRAALDLLAGRPGAALASLTRMEDT